MAAIATDELALLRTLAEPTRWRIVELLAREELCVCHLVEELGVAQPLVSHHLRVLRDAGVVDGDRHGYWTYYRLDPAAVGGLAAALARMAEGTPPVGDRRRPCC